MKRRFYRNATDFSYLKGWITDERTHALWCANRIPYPLEEKSLCSILQKEQELDGGCAYTITDESDRPIGFYCYSFHEEERCGFIRYFVVDNERRQKGLGREILSQLLQAGRQDGRALEVRLNVFTCNAPALKCYAKAGFRDCNIQRPPFLYQKEQWESKQLGAVLLQDF